MTFAATSASTNPSSRRNIAIAGGVVLLHVGVLWALQSGLLRRAVEVVVPVAIMTELVEPPKPIIEPPPPPLRPAPKPPEPIPAPAVKQRPQPAPPPAPKPVAVPNLPPAPAAPVGVVAPQPPAPPNPAPVAIAPAPPVPAPPPPAPAPPRVQLPSSDADYLQNPKPVYPPISKRLGEQGVVMVRVLIGVDGTAQDAQLKDSSGFDRLDRAAIETARKWRYVPGKRNGVPETMWFNVPINFVIEQN